MLKRFSFLLILVFVVSILSSCGSTVKASLGTEFTLSVGQSARIASETIDIKFIGVTADSRCATGLECFWAGEVSCELEITLDGISNHVTMTEPAPLSGNTLGIYSFNINVLPYPEKGKEIDPNDYRLKMTVIKK